MTMAADRGDAASRPSRAQLGRVDVDDVPARPEVAVPRPRRADADVRDPLPGQTLHAVRPRGEVDGPHALQLGARGLVGYALDLHGLLVIPPDDERDARLAAKVLHLAGRSERVEDDLEVVADRVPDDGRLGRAGGRDGRLHAEPMAAEECEELGAGHGRGPGSTAMLVRTLFAMKHPSCA